MKMNTSLEKKEKRNKKWKKLKDKTEQDLN